MYIIMKDDLYLMNILNMGIRELTSNNTYEEVPNYTHEWDFWDLTLRKMLYDWLPIRHDVLLPE